MDQVRLAVELPEMRLRPSVKIYTQGWMGYREQAPYWHGKALMYHLGKVHV